MFVLLELHGPSTSLFDSFVAWSRPSETLVLSRKAIMNQVLFMRIAQPPPDKPCGKNHSRSKSAQSYLPVPFIQWMYTGFSQGTYAMGLVDRSFQEPGDEVKIS